MQSHGASMLLAPLRRGTDEIAARDFPIKASGWRREAAILLFRSRSLTRLDELIK